MWVDLRLGEAFALVCHIDFSLEIFSSFTLLYSYCHLLSSGSSHLLGLKPILSTTLQTTIRSMYSLLKNLRSTSCLQCWSTSCLKSSARVSRHSTTEFPSYLHHLLSWYSATGNPLLQSLCWCPLCTPLLAQVTSWAFHFFLFFSAYLKLQAQLQFCLNLELS